MPPSPAKIAMIVVVGLLWLSCLAFIGYSIYKFFKKLFAKGDESSAPSTPANSSSPASPGGPKRISAEKTGYLEYVDYPGKSLCDYGNTNICNGLKGTELFCGDSAKVNLKPCTSDSGKAVASITFVQSGKSAFISAAGIEIKPAPGLGGVQCSEYTITSDDILVFSDYKFKFFDCQGKRVTF
jgi:hypothetical protein